MRVYNELFAVVQQLNYPKEQYLNHNGDVENFLQTVVVDGGIAETIPAEHYMNLTAGFGGSAGYGSKKQWTPSSKIVSLSFLIRTPTNGVGGTNHRTQMGFISSYTDFFCQCVSFREGSDNQWKCLTWNGVGLIYTDIDPLQSYDFVRIELQNNRAAFFRNGVLLAIHTTYIPAVPLYGGVFVTHDPPGITTSQKIEIDDIEIVNTI